MFKATYLGDMIYFDTFDEVKKYYNHDEADDIDELNEILKKESDGMVSPLIEEIGLEYLIHSRPDEEICDFIDKSKTWDAYGVQECFEYLCKKYDISMKDDCGNWFGGDELLERVKNAILRK